MSQNRSLFLQSLVSIGLAMNLQAIPMESEQVLYKEINLEGDSKSLSQWGTGSLNDASLNSKNSSSQMKLRSSSSSGGVYPGSDKLSSTAIKSDNKKSSSIEELSDSFNQNVNIMDRSITLRPLSSEDINDFMTWAGDPEVTEYLLWDYYKTKEAAFSFLKNVVDDHPWFMAIVLDDHVIGAITLTQGKGSYSCKAELGYVLAKQYWGKKYGTQAVALAIQKGFSELPDLQRIEAHVDPGNKASQRVLEKSGFSQEGLLKSYILQKNVLRDRYIYATFRDH